LNDLFVLNHLYDQNNKETFNQLLDNIYFSFEFKCICVYLSVVDKDFFWKLLIQNSKKDQREQFYISNTSAVYLIKGAKYFLLHKYRFKNFHIFLYLF